MSKTRLLLFIVTLVLVGMTARPLWSADQQQATSQVQDILGVKGELVIDSTAKLFAAFVSANQLFNYRSLLTYEANGYITTYELKHWVEDNTFHQQLLFLDGPRREVFRRQGFNICRSDESVQGTIWPSASPAASLNSYSLKSVGLERVADRQTIIFDVLPRDDLRYGYRYSVDRKTGLVLKVITYEKEKIVERLQTVSIEFLESKSDVIADNNPGYVWRVPEIEPCQTEQFQPGWRVEWLPEGFSLVGTRLTAQGEQVLIFTDGLVSLSVFITNYKSKSLPKATARHGATVVVIAPMESQSGRSIAVVGEVPTVTARRIAVSVKPL